MELTWIFWRNYLSNKDFGTLICLNQRWKEKIQNWQEYWQAQYFLYFDPLLVEPISWYQVFISQNTAQYCFYGDFDFDTSKLGAYSFREISSWKSGCVIRTYQGELILVNNRTELIYPETRFNQLEGNCAIQANNKLVYYFGENWINFRSPQILNFNFPVQQIVSNSQYWYARDIQGLVYEMKEEKAIRIVSLPFIVCIRAGNYRIGAIDQDGKMWVWQPSFIPELINLKSRVVDLAIGQEHLVILDNQKRIWGMGYNHFGQIGELPNSEIPQLWATEPILRIWTGNYHTFLQFEDGIIAGYGKNNYGQIDDQLDQPVDQSVDQEVDQNISEELIDYATIIGTGWDQSILLIEPPILIDYSQLYRFRKNSINNFQILTGNRVRIWDNLGNVYQVQAKWDPIESKIVPIS